MRRTGLIGAVFLVAGLMFAGVVEDSGVKGGLVVQIGCGDGEGLTALCLNDRYIVQGLDTDDENIQKARRAINKNGFYGRVTAYRFDGKSLPYADNLVNLVIGEKRTWIRIFARSVSDDEIMRVLAPGGVAMLDGRKIIKPVPAGIDSWTHYLHGPDNNAVAGDTVVSSPRSIQWVSGPRWGRSHEELASMSAAVTDNGRIFYIVDDAPLAFIRFDGQWSLVARDAFNGVKLWTKPISKWSDHLRHFRAGPLHLPRRLVVEGDVVYVTLGLDAPVTALDAATGKVLKTYEGTQRTEEILVQDGILYLVVGTSEVYRAGEGLYSRGEPGPAGFRYITAVDAESGKTLWKTESLKDEYILPLTLTVKGDNVFYQSTAGIVSLEGKSGRELWKTPRLTPVRRMSFSSPTVVATEEVLLCADRNATEETAATNRVEWGVHGWNDPGYPRNGKTTLKAYSIATGKELWSAECSEGYNSPVDIFVIGDTVWAGSDFKGYDLKTGSLKTALNWKGPKVGMPHHRCYRDKATENFILTGRSGIEMVSLENGNIGNNSWIRGTCQYGIMPANGLLYAPPNACACFLRVKLEGFFAAAPHRNKSRMMEFSESPALEKGKAYGKLNGSASESEDGSSWPMYRHDSLRSGAVPVGISSSVKKKWQASIGGRITQPVTAGDKLFIASSDTHTIHALDVENGKEIWSYIAGGRIDSAPTIYRGAVLFGCADGWIYSLRASDGELAWRFRAAPQERLIGAYEQLESVWPVHGAVLVQNDNLYAAAGRSSYIDGGMVLYRLDPVTGRELSRTSIYDLDPATDLQKGGEGGFDMEGVTTDVLSGDGESVYIKHLGFDRNGNRMTGETRPHLFAASGLLGEEWFVRSYWLRGTYTKTGWGGWADVASEVPFGRILSFNGDKTYGYGRVTISSAATGHKADAYHLFSKSPALPIEKTVEVPAPKEKGKNQRRSPAKPSPVLNWANDKSLIVRAMVLAEEQLVIAGPPDLGKRDDSMLAFLNPDESLSGFMGEKGVFLRILSAADGKMVFEQQLESMPVFDGMSSANGKLFISMKNGNVECWE